MDQATQKLKRIRYSVTTSSRVVSLPKQPRWQDGGNRQDSAFRPSHRLHCSTVIMNSLGVIFICQSLWELLLVAQCQWPWLCRVCGGKPVGRTPGQAAGAQVGAQGAGQAGEGTGRRAQALRQAAREGARGTGPAGWQAGPSCRKAPCPALQVTLQVRKEVVMWGRVSTFNY